MGTTAWPSKAEWAVLGATALYVAAAAVAAVTGNAESIFSIAVMFMLVAAVVSVHRRVGFSAYRADCCKTLL